MISLIFLKQVDLGGSKILFSGYLMNFEGLIFSLYPDSDIDYKIL
jgi:hypothetical protein